MFKLDIYTWPACRGVDPQIRASFHEKPDDAKAHVKTQTEPFAFAVLQCRDPYVDRPNEDDLNPGNSWMPCDWNGNYIGRHGKWPSIYGVNGEHPAVTAMFADWATMKKMIQKEYATTHEAMIEIASRLLKERHPETYGWQNHLAWDAASK